MKKKKQKEEIGRVLLKMTRHFEYSCALMGASSKAERAIIDFSAPMAQERDLKSALIMYFVNQIYFDVIGKDVL